MKKKIFLLIKIILLTTIVAVVVFGVYCISIASGATLNTDSLKIESATFRIYDKNNREIRLVGYGSSVEWDKLPKNLVNAFVCIEDKNFFSHNGVDALRILKATVKNLISLDLTAEGASTITQQLIKNTHLSGEKTVERKIQEIKLALDLENVYTKEEIFQSYLNVLYFGNSIYGVSEASYAFFGKDYTELTLSECAVLAGVVKSPATYSPLRNYDKSLDRRNFILKEMYNDGYINKEDYITAVQEKIRLVPLDKTGATFIDAVISEATEILGITENELAYGGYKIYTDYDVVLQETVENNAKSSELLPLNNAGKASDVCILVANNDSGLVSAYYGNLSTVDFYRQPGSTLKPFLSYLPSLSEGKIHPASPMYDEKKAYGSYIPKNYGDRYIGWTNARYALSKSINTVAVELMNNYGINKSIEYCQKYGISFVKEDYNLATALGGMTKGVTPLQMCSAYMTLANSGYYKKVGFVKYITDKNSEKLTNIKSYQRKVENDEVCYLMTDMLYDTVKYGTAGLLSSEYKIASKTGTVQNASDSSLNNDLWNISYTSKNTLCVWLGNANNSADTAIPNGYTASVYPTRIAKNIYTELYKSEKPADIQVPDGIESLPYSKEAYEMEHTLILANEFYTSEEVKYDIFNSTLLPDTSNREFKGEVDLSDFEVYLKQGQPNITLTTQNGIKYAIMRCSLLGEWENIATIDGDGTRYTYTDMVAGGYDYSYKTEAYVVNYAGDKKYLESSKEYLVSVPYELWIDQIFLR